MHHENTPVRLPFLYVSLASTLAWISWSVTEVIPHRPFISEQVGQNILAEKI